MTHFERTYLQSRPPQIVISYNNSSNFEGSSYDLTDALQKHRQEIAMQMEYRELDRLAMELERELQAIKAIRAEMEQYKIDFNLTVEDEATKKVEEVIKRIDNILK